MPTKKTHRITIYNTLHKKKEIIKPLKGKRIALFVCGPTVYDFSHIGHARTCIVFDCFARYLKHAGFDVFYLQNITNIDDKIIAKAREKGVLAKDLADAFEKEYLKDMKLLGIASVKKYARATDYIKEIISQVKRLLEKEYAYALDDGIYFDIKKCKGYGKLSSRSSLQADDAVSRIDYNTHKKNRGDFCLWKIAGDHNFNEPSWPSPFGRGRPGWHIEDTAITEKFFGPQYDIHGGGRDLIFPHHEAEIAQQESASGLKPFVKYWLHTGFLTVDSQKMSKSLGNFITINDFLRNHSPRLLRFLIIKSAYRSPIDYNGSAILQAEKELGRIDEFVDSLKTARTRLPQNIPWKLETDKKFGNAMDDDFNTPRAIAIIFRLIRQKNSLNAKDVLEFLRRADKFFDFIFWPKAKEKIPAELSRLAGQRQEYREKKEWHKADEIRKEMKKLGWTVEDTDEGPKVKHLQ